MPEPVRAVLFDYGGVLAEEGFQNGLRALARAQGLEPEGFPLAGMYAVYDSGFVLGDGTAADFWRLMRERTGLRGDDVELTGTILAGFVLRPRMIGMVRRLRAAGLITAILSDQTHWLDQLDARDRFQQEFDHVYNSYYLGKGKRDPSLFPEVAADLGLPPSALLFIDDSPGNIERARTAGYQVHLFTGEAGCLALLESLLA